MSSVKRRKISWSKKRITLIVSVGVILAVAIGGMVFWLVTQHAPNSEPVAKQSDTERAAAAAKQAESDGKLREAASNDIKNNNTAGAQKSYQTAIDSEASIVRKTQLYIDLSGVYYAAGQYDQAFTVAKIAENLNPDKFLVADWLARLYEDRKDYTQAVAYYRLAGQWANSTQNQTAITKDMYNAEAARVEKLAAGGGS